ncbi:BatD family protein [Pedobacter metabolipauper]|nr:BatD family protein [Pedobacter metabolipauper]
MKIKYYVWLVLLFISNAAAAQDIKFVASASKTQVATGETFEVTFTANGNIDNFKPPGFGGFQVLSGPNQSSSMSSINGVTSVNIGLSYYLVPIKEGEFAIGPAIAIANGKQYRSAPLRIKVTKGRAVPQNNQSAADPVNAPATGNSTDISKRIFIRAVTNKSNVYQGEQLSVSYKLYTNIEIVDNGLDKLPDFNGFWSQEIKNNSQTVKWTTETYKGTRYNVALLKEIILFPERYGDLTLDPLAMTFVVRQSSAKSNDPFDLFFGSYEDVKYKIKSAPIAIHVKPLPEAGKPAGFQGAVGNFALLTAADKTELKANEALNYSIRITGSGNLKLLKTPEITFAADLEKYDPKVNDRITETVSGVSGTREYTYLLIPRHQGNYKIEPYKFSYFNPVSRKYITLTGSEFNLKVAKGAPGSAVAAFPAGSQQDVKMIDKDIRYIKTEGDLTKSGDDFFGSLGYYMLLAAGPVLFIAAFGYRKWHREHNKDVVVVKERKAGKLAVKHLETAQKQLQAGNQKAFYEAIYRGLYGYLADKFNIAAAALNKDHIAVQLRERKMSEGLITQLIETLDLCEMARYAPVSGTGEQQVYEKAKQIINDIENA